MSQSPKKTWSAAEFEANADNEDWEPDFESDEEEDQYWKACDEYWDAKEEECRAALAKIELVEAQGIKPGATIPDGTPQPPASVAITDPIKKASGKLKRNWINRLKGRRSVAISRPRFRELDALRKAARRELVRKAWFVGVWFLFAFILALTAFGVQNLTKGGSAFVAVVETPGAFRVAAFVGLGLMIAFGAVWLWREIRKRHAAEDVGMFMVYTGIAGGLLLAGSYLLDVDMGEALAAFLLISSPVMFFYGILVMKRARRRYVPPVYPARQSVQPYARKETTVYGDARTADDWEVHESLRDKSGGFDPMFKD